LDTSICWGQSFEQYSQSGTYIDTLPSFFGCDSIRTLNLDVYVTEKYDFISICSGSQFNDYLASGHYRDTLEGLDGACDTMYFLELTILPPEHTFVSQHICQGEQYFGYGQAGVYTDSLQTMEGCDSVRTVELEILPIRYSEVVAAHCEGSQYGYVIPGMYIDTLVSSLGCDSIRILHLEGSVSYIPNIFSPNGDQINDVFEISTFPEGVSGFEYFAIFDRFGDKVYETSARPIRWDGKNKVSGRYYNPGVYTWVWSTICNTKHVMKHGNITLLR
jgi:gliding motility-associated-like protein